MFENTLDAIKELFASENSSKKIRYVLSLILFSELIFIAASNLFPLYDCILFFYPGGVSQEIIKILEIIFYVAFTLSVIYVLSFWGLIIIDTILDIIMSSRKDYTINLKKILSAKNKILELSHGCEFNLIATNEVLLIVLIPSISLNPSMLSACCTNHPFLVFLLAL